MKKFFVPFIILMICCFLTQSAGAVVLKTASSFAGNDTVADVYAGLLRLWQEKTNHTVIDSSRTADEDWKISVLNDFAAGNEADILFFFAKTADNAPLLGKVVPISEINAMYPALHLPENSSIAEADGKVYAIPVRTFWEGLFCNVDLFERCGLELPTTWEKLEKAIQVFNEKGITPIAVSLSDIPNYIAEFSILSAGPAEHHLARPVKGEAVPQSWIEGMDLIYKLYQMNAFAENVNTTTYATVSQQFCDKQAAMQLDGSWFANGFPMENMDNTVVIPFPCYDSQADSSAFIGGVSMGFYLTRSAWENPEKRDAAVELLAFLATGENAQQLGGFTFTGKLLESVNMMLEGHMNPPLQDDMDPHARAIWFGAISGIADGTEDPAAMWETVMNLEPFKEEAK